jgi:hypothetical protein
VSTNTVAASTSDINFTDKAILSWGTTAQGDTTTVTNFRIATGETYNYASTGNVLNKVTAGSNTTHTDFNGLGATAAVINGNLVGSSANVYILANGNITVGNGASISTRSLVLSTLTEPSDSLFVATGNLTSPTAASPTSTGSISIGTATISGNLTAAAGSVTNVGGGTVAGDLVVRSVTSGAATNLASGAALVVTGNLSVTTNNGAITETNTVSVGAGTTGDQTTSLTSGSGAITLATSGAPAAGSPAGVSNDFEVLTINTTGSATIRDANIVTLGASSVGGDLSVTVGGKTDTTAISTSGAVVIGGNASLISASSANSSISIGNNSSIGGWASAATAGGSVTINTTGNLTLGNITTNLTATTLAGGAYTALAATTNALGTGGTVTGATLTAGTTAPIYTGNVTATFTSPTASATSTLTGTAVSGATIVGGGSGYTAAPTVTIVGGGGTGATATATLTGDVVTGITITAGGSGYTTAPTIIISDPVTGAVAAQGRAVRDATTGLITGVEITNAGFGYGATLPTVSFTTVNTENNFSSGGVTATTTGALSTTIAGISGLSSGIRSGQGVSLTGTTISTAAPVVGRTNANAAISFTATAGGVTFGDVVTANRLSVNTSAAGGAITQVTTTTPSGNAAGAVITTSSNSTSGSTLNAGNGTITLDTVANSFSNNSPISITAGAAALRSTNNIVVGTTNVTGNLSVIARPTSAGNRGVQLGTGTGIGNGQNITVGGVLAVTANSAGSITDNDYSIIRATGGLNLAVTAGTDAVPTVGTGNVTLDGATVVGTRAEFGQVNVSTTGNVSVAETTTLNLGNIGSAASPVASLRAESTQGGIVNTGNVFVSTSGNTTFVVPANQTVTISGASNVLPYINLIGGGDSSITNVNSNVVLGNATSVGSGNVTIGTNSGFGITLGSFDITGALTVNSGSWIDVAGSANITGNLTLNATGNIPSAATLTGTGSASSPTFGSFYAPTATINNTTGAITGIGATNFPMLSFASTPTFTLVGGSLPTTAATLGTPTLNAGGGLATIPVTAGGAGYVVSPTVTLSAPPAGGIQATATATVAGGVITGFTITNAGAGYAAAPTITLSGGGNPTTVATIAPNLNSAGEITSFSVTNGGGGTLPYNTAYPLSYSVAGATTTSITETAGALRVTGTTNISSPGNALLWRGNDFTNVVLNNSTGGAVINDVNNLSVSGSSGGSVIARAGANGSGTIGTNAAPNVPTSVANTWALTLGNISANSLTAIASNGGGGNSGTVTQLSGTSIHSETTAHFETTNANIVIGNNGNSFGRVELAVNSTDASRTVTVVEDGTLKLGNLSSRGTTNLTSRFGSIIEDPTADVVITQNGTLNATASNGSILIGNTTHTAGVTTANIVTFNGTAPNGQIAITSNNSTTLAGINANSLTVNVTGGNGNITQSSALKVFGTANFTATRNITLTNNANNFGRVFLATTDAARDIQITEAGTLNLGGVTMPAGSTGNFTATSVSGDIIDTGLGGLRPGGVVGTPGSGVITLNAASGNITLDDPTTDFPTTGGIAFTANNVTLAPLGTAPIFLGAAGVTSTATGNLTVTSATGNILNAGALSITGDAYFQSGSGDILLTNAANNFGTVRFAGKVVSISEAGNMTIVTGSTATDVATFTSGASIDVLNRGGIISLAKTGFFVASANITLSALQAGDTLTLSAVGKRDLSALSLSRDLANKSPVYVPPFNSGVDVAPQP